MQDKVSADTISKLTLKSGFLPDTDIVPPTADELIKKISQKLEKDIYILRKKVKSTKLDSAEPPSPFEISLKRAEAKKDKFEMLVSKDIPKGFKIAPVLYSKITREENAKTWKEFSKRVNRPFMSFLGNNHEDELKNLGLCQNAIDKMKRGLNPVDKNGMKYDINVDHIVERSGGGSLSLNKAIDNNRDDESNNVFFVNHFNNFVLLPVKIHDIKNSLNEAQSAAMTQQGKSRWVLMLVPENNPKFSGFVAQPQDKKHPLSGLDMVEETVYNHIGQTNYLISRADKKIKELIYNERKPEVDKYNSSLTDVFNAAVLNNPKNKNTIEEIIIPDLIEATHQLKTVFNKASKKNTPQNDYKSFLQFYQGHKIRTLSHICRDIPLKAANDFHDAVKDIDRQIAIAKESKKHKPNSGNLASQKNRPK